MNFTSLHFPTLLDVYFFFKLTSLITFLTFSFKVFGLQVWDWFIGETGFNAFSFGVIHFDSKNETEALK